ncbi:MAG: type I methionyl aminopeptidase [Bradymonadales bacterium]|nr:type I methionyl aminopeptidase [Bradymonadales bacterium]
MAIELKTAAEIEQMRAAGQLVRQVLDAIGVELEPLMTTGHLNRLAERMISDAGAVPAFLGYPHPRGGAAFPAVLCTSRNEEIVHGIPSDRVVLKEGDILSVDCGVRLQGFYGDAARSYAVGKVDERAKNLLEVTNQALHLAIEMCSVGARLNGLGKIVQEHVERHGFSVVRDFVGHGIGRRLHEEPRVPNYCDGNPMGGPILRAGMVLAIEPMVNEGSHLTEVLEDRWTVVTRDRSRSAHFEHTVAITQSGPEILTGAID